MKHKIIKTDNYLLVVDDSDIKVYDCITDNYKVWKWNDDSSLLGRKKVICHLPLNNSPILEGVDLLPPLVHSNCCIAKDRGLTNMNKSCAERNRCLSPLEDEVEKMANKWAIDNADITMESNSALNKGFKAGYNKAKEKYKYTEENILIIRNKLVSMLPKGDVSAWDMIVAASKYTIWFDNYIQHLQQPKIPVGFECEVITMNKGCNEESDYPYQQCDIPKTITNSQGITQLVGTYKYKQQ